MKIDLDWIQEELDAGREVSFECVDSNRFLEAHTTTNKLILRQENLIVESVFDNYGVFLKGELKGGASNYIHRKEFECFRIKLPTPTFDNLIDILIKANKDNIVSRVEIGRNGLNATVSLTESESTKFHIGKDEDGIVFKEYIDWINSLYTETFVIESEEDINKVISRKDIGFNKNSMSVATLTNGSEILITRLDSDNSDGVVIYMRRGLYKNYMDFEVLKGATVTQQKGNK